jgi:hypothetical protein
MVKFYREEARRILAAQKKLSTILITERSALRLPPCSKTIDSKRMTENHYLTRVIDEWLCGKAEDGRG